MKWRFCVRGFALHEILCKRHHRPRWGKLVRIIPLEPRLRSSEPSTVWESLFRRGSRLASFVITPTSRPTRGHGPWRTVADIVGSEPYTFPNPWGRNSAEISTIVPLLIERCVSQVRGFVGGGELCEAWLVAPTMAQTLFPTFADHDCDDRL